MAFRSRFGCALIFLAVAGAVVAGSPAAAQSPSAYSEIRLGILDHDLAFAGGVEPGVDINLEVTSPSIVSQAWNGGAPLWVQWLLHPRLHAGVEVNTAGATDTGYVGFTWTARLADAVLRPDDAIEFSYLFGPSFNDGEHHSDRSDRKSLGANVLFHLGAEITYRFTPRFSIGLYYDHDSDAHLARYNASLNDAGLRLGYRF